MLKETLATMSTAHLTEETFNSIDKSKATFLWGLGIYPYEYGWFFYIGDDEYDLDEMPEDLAILVEWKMTYLYMSKKDKTGKTPVFFFPCRLVLWGGENFMVSGSDSSLMAGSCDWTGS